jgi:hypothetical protein
VATLDALDELHHFPLWEKELQTRATDRVRAWLLDGRVKTAESVQKQLVGGALQWLLDLGLIEKRTGQPGQVTLALAEKFSAPEALETALNHYGRFLFSYRTKAPKKSTPEPAVAAAGQVGTAQRAH